MSYDDETEVSVTFTVTTEYNVWGDLPYVAGLLGVSKAKLKKILAGDDELGEVSDAAFEKLKKEADVSNEEFTLEDISEN